MNKKLFAAVGAAALLFTACGAKETVIPSPGEIKSNLEAAKYSVSLNTSDVDGTMINAKSGDEYLSFYKLDSAEDCDRLYDTVLQANSNAEVSYKYSNDATFGNVIICGTKDAVKAAGITIVKVKE